MKWLERRQEAVVALFRMVIGLLFLCHGAATLFGVLGGAAGPADSVPVNTWPGGYAALIQLVTGSAVLIGLATRPAAIIASGSMAFAYFSVHQEIDTLPIENGGESAVLFCWSFFLLAVTGSGLWSVDGFARSLKLKRAVNA